MDREELKKVLEGASVEEGDRRRLSCAKAFIIAGEYGVKLGEIGDSCNESGIRISNCQLKCFE